MACFVPSDVGRGPTRPVHLLWEIRNSPSRGKCASETHALPTLKYILKPWVLSTSMACVCEPL